MPIAKLMMTAVGATAMLGVVAGASVPTTMIDAPEPAWRKMVEKPYQPALADPYAEDGPIYAAAMPEDLAPRRLVSPVIGRVPLERQRTFVSVDYRHHVEMPQPPSPVDPQNAAAALDPGPVDAAVVMPADAPLADPALPAAPEA